MWVVLPGSVLPVGSPGPFHRALPKPTLEQHVPVFPDLAQPAQQVAIRRLDILAASSLPYLSPRARGGSLLLDGARQSRCQSFPTRNSPATMGFPQPLQALIALSCVGSTHTSRVLRRRPFTAPPGCPRAPATRQAQSRRPRQPEKSPPGTGCPCLSGAPMRCLAQTWHPRPGLWPPR